MHEGSVSAKNTERARRIEPVPELDAEAGTADPDYASSFVVDVLEANTRSPEQWARNTLEVHSSLISARKVLRVDHDRVTLTTSSSTRTPRDDFSGLRSHRSIISSNPFC